MHIFTTLGRADPELFRRWLGFGGALLAGSLPGRLRELVILRTAARFGGRYEWAQHIELAEAQGVTPDELAGGERRRCGRRLDAVEWSPLERAALRAVDETADDGTVSDATWAVAGGRPRGERAHRAADADRPLHDADDRARFPAHCSWSPGPRRWRSSVPGGPAA